MTLFSRLFSNGRKLDDWFSPILVKELRQGMRARAFVVSFLLIQVFLIILVMGNVAARGDSGALSFQNGFFWVIVGFALLLLMPLRGLNAIAQEMRRNTMETIMLTRLTAWRIVFGKWSALFAQSALFVSAVLPYVVLRYFIGGDDVVADLEYLILMLWVSGLLIAASIAASALNNVVIRVVVTLIGVWTVGVGSSVVNYGIFHRYDARILLGWFILYGFFIPALLFELAASAFAPISENHAMRRRALVLAFFVLASLLSWVEQSSDGVGAYLSLIILIGICYFELSEKARLLPRHVLPLARINRFGRMLGLFFLPGWPSALLFSLLVIPLAFLFQCTVFFDSYVSTHYLGVPLLIFAVFGSVLPPVLLCHLFWPKMNQVILIVILYNIILIGVASVLKGFSALTGVGLDQFLAFAPSVPVFLINVDPQETSDPSVLLRYCGGNVITLIFLIATLLAASRHYFAGIRELLRPAAAKSATSAQPEADAPAP